MGTRLMMDAVVKKSRTRKYIVLALLVVTPAGFLFKFYSGPAQWWFNNYGAGLLYEIFWILIGFFFLPKKELANKIPLWVLIGTSILEVLQLWHPWYLEKTRSYFLGRALIGTSFTWWDFPHYVVGCLLGWLVVKLIIKRCDDMGQ
jgi:hypothetical protein